MSGKMRDKRSVLGIVLITIVLILVTRMLTISHNAQLHPDEKVFVFGSSSMANAMLHPGTPFEEWKEYPEGAYLFQAVFQLLGRGGCRIAGIPANEHAQLFGRISSVFYFAAAVVLGMRLIKRYLGKTNVSLAIYGAVMCFSLFFIEQSRYGTGDIISLALLMLMLNLTAKAMESDGQIRWWLASFFVSGVLCAVKYPQLVFALIPLLAFLSHSRRGRWIAAMIAACAAGFFLFSPKALLDPAYIYRVFQQETDAYFVQSPHERGGVLNHLATLLVYILLYSDVPVLPPLVMAGLALRLLGLIKAGKKNERPEGTKCLFDLIVPGVCLLFFLYNLFVPTLFFRTYTPFFGLLALYTAAAAEKWFLKGTWGKTAVLLLTGVMVLRGVGFLWVLWDDEKPRQRLNEMVSANVDKNWKESWYIGLFTLPADEPEGVEIKSAGSLGSYVEMNDSLELQPGQMVITGAQAFYLGQDYLLPVAQQEQFPIQLWYAMQETNKEYLIGQVYPDLYYYLFGGWLRGTTLSQYEIPCNTIYYRSR